MNYSSASIGELVEPVLYALRKGSSDALAHALAKATSATRSSKKVFRGAGQTFHQPSFDLGVASTFVEILATATQRAPFAEAIRELKRIPEGIARLHEIAFVTCFASASQRELAEQLGIDPGNFSRLVGKLSEIGLIESNQQGRAKQLSLTELGQDVLNEVVPGWKAVDPADGQAVVRSEREAMNAANAFVQSRLAASELIHQVSASLIRRPARNRLDGDLLATAVQGSAFRPGALDNLLGEWSGKLGPAFIHREIRVLENHSF